MQAEGVLPTPRHFNPVIQTQAQMGSFKAAEALIYEMANSSLGDLLKPNADSYNCLLKGYIEFATAGEFSVGDKIGELARLDGDGGRGAKCADACAERRGVSACHGAGGRSDRLF